MSFFGAVAPRLRSLARRDAVVAPHDLHGAGRRRAGAAGADRQGRRDVRHVGAARQRPARRRLRHFRRDDLDAVPALHRAGARRVLRHGADGRRSRRQDDHLSVHAADSARRGAGRQVPRVSGLHLPGGAAVGDDRLLPAGAVLAVAGHVRQPADRPRACWPWAWRSTAACSRSSARSSSGRW